MKKMILIFVVLFSVLVSGCDLFNTTSDKPDFKYSFKTAKDHYTADSTTSKPVKIKATFTNQSNQTLYLNYQVCMLVHLEKRYILKEWKPITIPILCPAVVKGPVKVKPGHSIQVGINLEWWTEPVKPIQSGVYRFTLSVSKSVKKQPVEISSNQFKITYDL